MIHSNLIPLPILYVAAGIFGVIFGSLLSMAVHRNPDCGATIAFHDRIPLLNYFSSNGRCQEGKTHISTRYPVIEALSGFLCVAIAWHNGLTFALPFDLIFVCAITALVFIDAEHMILPDVITLPGIGFALIARLAIPALVGQPYFDDVPGLQELTGWSDVGASLFGAILGALAGGGSLFLMGEAWKRLRHVEAMGLGDVKMMFMVGAYLGWRLTILNIFLGALTGSIIGIGITLYQGRRDLQGLLPYGVYLGIGAIVALFFGSQIVKWYAGFYG